MTATDASIPTSYVGSTGLRITRLGYGCVPLGNYPEPLSEPDAYAALTCAYDLGIRYFDVAPLYGHGLAEHRLGTALRRRTRGDFVLSTKVGRLLVASPDAALQGDASAGIFSEPLPFSLVNNYTYDGIMRSVEDSLQRLGLASIDILHVHNIDPANHDPDSLEALFRQCMSDGYRALEKLRGDAVIKAIGVGNNSLAMCGRFLREGDFDCIMMAGHFHLLDQSAASEFLPQCERRGVSVLVGSPFASGLLAASDPATALYMYKAPAPGIVAKLKTIHEVCAAHRTSPIAAALQFPLQHSASACVVTGMRTEAEVRDCVAAFRSELPSELYRDLQDANVISREVALSGSVAN